MLRRMILVCCLLCLAAALAQYEPQKTQTRDTLKLHGAVASIVQYTSPGEWREGKWQHPEGTVTAESRMEFDAGGRLLLHTMRNGVMIPMSASAMTPTDE